MTALDIVFLAICLAVLQPIVYFLVDFTEVAFEHLSGNTVKDEVVSERTFETIEHYGEWIDEQEEKISQHINKYNQLLKDSYVEENEDPEE